METLKDKLKLEGLEVGGLGGRGGVAVRGVLGGASGAWFHSFMPPTFLRAEF